MEPTTPYTSRWNVDTPGVRRHVKGAGKGQVVWRSIHFDTLSPFIKTLNTYSMVKLGKRGQQIVSTSISPEVVWDWQNTIVGAQDIYILLKINLPERFPIIEVSDVIDGGEMEEIALLNVVGGKRLTFHLLSVKQSPISDFKYIVDDEVKVGYASAKSRAYVYEGYVSYMPPEFVPRTVPDTYISRKTGLLDIPKHFKYLPKLRYNVSAYKNYGVSAHPYSDIEVTDTVTNVVCIFNTIWDYKTPEKLEFIVEQDTMENLQECKRLFRGEGWIDEIKYND